VAFSPDGQTLASVEQGIVTLWDVHTRTRRGTLPLGQRASPAFSQRGDLLAAGAEDGSITVWDLKSDQRLGVVQGPVPSEQLVQVAFLDDGRALASAVPFGGLMLWDLDVRSWQMLACSLAGRDMSEPEWRLYAGSHPCRSTCP
jgi:WD40 repeat protein